MIRNPQFQSCLPYLILKQKSERLYDLFEINIIRQSAYIVMRFDHRAFPKPAFDHIGINRSLYEKIYRADLLCLFLKYTDKFLSDDLSFCFRLRYSCKFFIKPVLRIDTDEIQIIGSVRPKYCFYLIAFILTQKPMVNKYAG